MDPIEELAHDHRELSGLILAVQEALARVAKDPAALEHELHEIRDGIEGLREELLEHFAREQEGLLPFVAARVPAFGARADQLIIEHDRMSEAVTKLASALAVDNPDLKAWQPTFVAFQALYADHSKTELAFLQEVAGKLAGDADATQQLKALLDAS